MKCEQAREAVHRELDDELAPEEPRTLNEHLQICRGCAVFAAQMRAVGAGLDALRKATQLDDVRPRRARRAAGGWGGGIAAGALAACVALLLFRDPAQPAASPPRPALAQAPNSTERGTGAAALRRVADSTVLAAPRNSTGTTTQGAVLELSATSAAAYVPLELAVSVPQVRVVVLYPRVDATGIDAPDPTIRTIQEIQR